MQKILKLSKINTKSKLLSLGSSLRYGVINSAKPDNSFHPETKNRKGYDYSFLKDASYHGFKLLKQEDIPLFSIRAYILEHTNTKARYIHLHAPDQNNAFAFIFKTLPNDSKGAPHILEHTVLCGSEKYNVRDPFMNMIKRSLNTYMNAMTGTDFTCYLFSSQNEKDFKNLLDVYAESVFRPLIKYHDFLQEGWRYDFSKENDIKSDLIIKGVVYNEMKGVMQTPDNLFLENLQRSLYKGSFYENSAGGLPSEIPKLSYEELKNFYKKFYHPSNCCFFSYGDLDFVDNLKFLEENYLKNYEKIIPQTFIEQIRKENYSADMKITSPPDSVALDPEKQARFAISFLCNDIKENPLDVIGLNILSYLLFETPNSPLYKSLLESGLATGYCPGYGFDMNNKETSFTIGVRNIGHDIHDSTEIERTIYETLNDILQNGLDPQFIESVLHQIEVQAKAPKADFGISVLQSLIPFIINDANLLFTLKVDETLNKIRDSIKKGQYFENLISKYFLNNQHKIKLLMTPDNDYIKEETLKEQITLREIAKNMTTNQKELIIKQNIELKEKQEEIQNIDVLPTLNLEDIPKNSSQTNFENNEILGIPVSLTHQQTNGISYIRLKINTKDGPQYFRPFLRLFKQILPKVGTKTMKYDEFNQILDLFTYNFEVEHTSWSLPTDAQQYDEALILSIGCLDKNIDRMFDLITDLFNNPDFSDYENISNLIKILSSEAANSFVEDPLPYALSYASSGIRESVLKTEKLASSRFICNLGAQTLKNSAMRIILQEVERHMIGIIGSIFRKDIMSFCVHSNQENFDLIQRRIELMLLSFKTNKPAFNHSQKIVLTPHEKMEYDSNPNMDSTGFQQKFSKTYFALPMQVNYAVEAFQIPHFTHEHTPLLHILSEIMSLNVLHREIREKGGAYGSGCNVSGNGVMSFYSYRDPHTFESYNAFEKAIQWVSNGEMSERDIKEAKLKVFSNFDMVENPLNKGVKKFIRGISDEMVSEYRQKLLNANKDELVECSRKYLLESLKEGKSNQVIFGTQETKLEEMIKKGWRVERPVEGLSVSETSYEQNKNEIPKKTSE